MNGARDGDPVVATVIALTAFGATLRTGDGELATAPQRDVQEHRAVYERALADRKPLHFERRHGGRRPVLVLLPQIADAALDERIAAYLKSTQEWELPDAPPAHERHFLRKKKRSKLFEQRASAPSARRR